jgi:hypothetical protein
MDAGVIPGADKTGPRVAPPGPEINFVISLPGPSRLNLSQLLQDVMCLAFHFRNYRTSFGRLSIITSPPLPLIISHIPDTCSNARYRSESPSLIPRCIFLSGRGCKAADSCSRASNDVHLAFPLPLVPPIPFRHLSVARALRPSAIITRKFLIGCDKLLQ